MKPKVRTLDLQASAVANEDYRGLSQTYRNLLSVEQVEVDAVSDPQGFLGLLRHEFTPACPHALPALESELPLRVLAR
jgi:hypothetical protein